MSTSLERIRNKIHRKSRVITLYNQLNGLSSLAPDANTTNPWLTEMVHICLHYQKRDAPAFLAEIEAIAKQQTKPWNLGRMIEISQLAEFQMEVFWATRFGKFVGNRKAMTEELKKFWYNDNYRTIIGYELRSVDSLKRSPIKNIAFLGSGPLPLTAVHGALQRRELQVTCFDVEKRANDLAISWTPKLVGDQITYITSDVNDISDRALRNFDAIWVAAAIMNKGPVLMNLKRAMRSDAALVVRTAEGGCALLYKEVDLANLKKHFSTVKLFKPPKDVVNTAIVCMHPKN